MEKVKYLVSVDAEFNAINDWALREAAKEGNLELVKYLVSVGADYNAINVGRKKFFPGKTRPVNIMRGL